MSASTETPQAPEMIRVRVTRKHIKLGERRTCGRCPIALAIAEATGKTPRVMNFFAHIDKTQYRLSNPAQAFIGRFDMGHRVKPATFVLKRNR